MSVEETRKIWLQCDHRDEPAPGKVRGLRCYHTFGVDEFRPDELAHLIDDARRSGWQVTERLGLGFDVAESLCPEHRPADQHDGRSETA